LLPSFTIVAIASDAALLRSLAFALGVDGYRVEACDSWAAARDLTSAALCVIIDADICRKDADARRSLLDPANRMVLLADGMSPAVDHGNARVLTKPLAGSDILETVDLFRLSAT